MICFDDLKKDLKNIKFQIDLSKFKDFNLQEIEFINWIPVVQEEEHFYKMINKSELGKKNYKKELEDILKELDGIIFAKKEKKIKYSVKNYDEGRLCSIF